MSATANPWFNFVRWTEGGVEVSASADYPSRSLETGRWLRCLKRSPTSDHGGLTGGWGHDSGGGSHSSGAPVTVVAVANAGYAFVNWTEGGSRSARRHPTVPGGSQPFAGGELCGDHLLITTASSHWRAVRPLGRDVRPGSPVTVVAVANAGYAFVNWTEGGSRSATASYSFPAGANRSLVANFVAITTRSRRRPPHWRAVRPLGGTYARGVP